MDYLLELETQLIYYDRCDSHDETKAVCSTPVDPTRFPSLGSHRYIVAR